MLKVYQAERQAWPYLSETMTLDRARAFVAEVWASEFVARWRKTVTPPEVRDGRRRRSACGGPLRIDLPRWSRNEPVILHEIAHALTPGAHHGPRFATVYLALVQEFCSPRETARLERAYRRLHVRVQ